MATKKISKLPESDVQKRARETLEANAKVLRGRAQRATAAGNPNSGLMQLAASEAERLARASDPAASLRQIQEGQRGREKKGR